MRALCENCSRPQPVDWKPGDLCIDCGQAVRREVRCFWCAKWTPAGKFCRRCGAAVLAESLYGAARMLREAGADRFRIPEMLTEFDADLIDNFTRIYQRHAATLHRHLDHLRFLEGFLQQRHWSDALEEQLIGELPWPDERLEKLSAANGPEISPPTGPRSRQEDLATARAIHAVTPFTITRCLASIVRFLLDDWEAQRDVFNMLTPCDPALRAEAALAFSNWRAIHGPGIPYGYRDLVAALRDCPLHLPADVRLALLREPGCELPAEAIAAADPEVRFMAALAGGHRDTLFAALREEDELRRFAAASRLIELDEFSGLGDVIRAASPNGQLGLLRAIARRAQPAPDIREAVYEVAEGTESREVRNAAVRVLCAGCPPGEVERLADTANGDSTAFQSILQRAGLPPEALVRLGAWFLEHGVFRADQYGMNDIAKNGRMPADFVPRHWDRANESARKELCTFAECQLQEYGDEELHRFLVGVAFAPGPAGVRATVFNSLYRWYRRLDVSGKAPIAIRMESIVRFFGSPPAFLSVYTRFPRDPALPELLRESILADPVVALIRYPDADVLPAFAAEPAAVNRLADAVSEVANDAERFDRNLRAECLGFLAWLARVPEFRKKMRARIAAFLGTDIDYHAQQALARLTTAGAPV